MISVFYEVIACEHINPTVYSFAVPVFLNVDPVKAESKHPTAVIRRSTLYLLRNLSLSCGIYAEKAQKEAVSALCGLMRKILDAGCNYGISKFDTVK